MRAGQYVKQVEGYSAFLPAPLPPKPPLNMDDDLLRLLSDADRALGRLDGVASVLPNPNLFVAMYVRHEAVLSSQIEGTQSTLEDLLSFEIENRTSDKPRDVEEVVNYVAAMNQGLGRLGELPLSLRLLREIHERLMYEVRGAGRRPGEFRTTQNWIGSSGSQLHEADFVPPPPHALSDALSQLEQFLHNRASFPVLIHAGLAHAQFETIHPFLDGNGRVGRLLITLLLCERETLSQPLLYLSYYLKAHRAQYYDRLMAVRIEGDWEGWIKFFLRGVFQVSQSATDTARAILKLRETHREQIAQLSSSNLGLRLLDYLFERPRLSVRMAEEYLDVSYVTAANVIRDFEDNGILREITGNKRNRRYRYDAYIDLFKQQTLNGATEPDA